MEVVNIHERTLDAPAEAVGTLIDGLASPDDRLWPVDRWPPMQFDRRLEVGATGGHGPIRYSIESFAPGRDFRFRFVAPEGFVGTHRFEVAPAAVGRATLRHVIEMRVSGRALVLWGLVIRPLHDALMEDALDRAAVFVGMPEVKRKWSWWVRFIRWMMRRRRGG